MMRSDQFMTDMAKLVSRVKVLEDKGYVSSSTYLSSFSQPVFNKLGAL